MSGTCNENVFISQFRRSVTLDGQGTATINGPDATTSTVSIRARGFTIRGFTITGGRTGVVVSRGGTALIDNNIIQNTGRNGIVVTQHSFARIINNTVQNNPNGFGIFVSESSAARIGFLSGTDTVARPNQILNNGNDGIRVQDSSNARIVGNTISNNTGEFSDGIDVRRVSHARISDNTINNNGDNGIRVRENSGVNLGFDTGTTIFDLPNNTTVNNAEFGLGCFINSYANGRLGTLNGSSGPTNFSSGCVDSTIP